MKHIALVAKSFLAIGLLILLTSSNFTYALSPAQKKVIDSGIGYFDVEEDATACSTGSGTGPLQGPAFPKISNLNDLADRIKAFIEKNEPASGLKNNAEDFVKLGQQYNVNPALLVGVGQLESQLGTDPNSDGPPPQHNFWGNVSNESGYPSYKASIEAYYKNLRQNSAYAKVWAKGDTATVEEIIYIATPSSENDTAAYVKNLHSIMREILNGMGGGGSTSTGCGGSNGLISAEGYSFPVAPQTKSGNTGLGALSAIPCQDPTCHHDNTPAFDIGRQPGSDTSAGAPVYAISDGTVDMLHTYSYNKVPIPGCFSLQFHSSKDNFWYWYGHIQNPRVRNGQIVKAGTQIAEIGLRKCTGNRSDPHLHIDRGCVRNGVPQKGGYASCRDDGMIELINKLWEGMAP